MELKIKCPICNSETTDVSEYQNNGIIGIGYRRWKISNVRCCNSCGVYFKPVKKENNPANETK
jgi:hypothetical protein